MIVAIMSAINEHAEGVLVRFDSGAEVVLPVVVHPGLEEYFTVRIPYDLFVRSFGGLLAKQCWPG